MKEVFESPADRLKAAKDNDELVDEKYLWQGGFSAKAMYGQWIAAGLVTILILAAMLFIESLRDNRTVWLVALILIAAIWIVLIGMCFYRKWSFWYELTTQRLKHRAGIIWRKLDRIELIDVDDVNYSQGLIQAILGVGDITITSSDISHPKLVLHGIANIREVADKIDDARRTERRLRGVHIESI